MMFYACYVFLLKSALISFAPKFVIEIVSVKNIIES